MVATLVRSCSTRTCGNGSTAGRRSVKRFGWRQVARPAAVENEGFNLHFGPGTSFSVRPKAQSFYESYNAISSDGVA